MEIKEQRKGKMKIYIGFIIGLFFVFNTTLSGQTEGIDTQVWNVNTVEFPLDRKNEKLTGLILSDLRVEENVSYLADIRLGFGVNYDATENLSIQSSYLFRTIRSSGSSNRYEHHLRFDVTPAKKFKNFSIDNRFRLEHRIRTGGREDNTFYRNRARLRVPVKSGEKTIVTPFISNDISFDLRNVRVFRNDLSMGINRKINDSISLNLFYQYRRNFQTGTKHENVIGSGFVITLD